MKLFYILSIFLIVTLQIGESFSQTYGKAVETEPPHFPVLNGEITESVSNEGYRIYSGEIINSSSELVAVEIIFLSKDINKNIIDRNSNFIQGIKCPISNNLVISQKEFCVEPQQSAPFELETRVIESEIDSYSYEIKVWKTND